MQVMAKQNFKTAHYVPRNTFEFANLMIVYSLHKLYIYLSAYSC